MQGNRLESVLIVRANRTADDKEKGRLWGRKTDGVLSADWTTEVISEDMRKSPKETHSLQDGCTSCTLSLGVPNHGLVE